VSKVDDLDDTDRVVDSIEDEIRFLKDELANRLAGAKRGILVILSLLLGLHSKEFFAKLGEKRTGFLSFTLTKLLDGPADHDRVTGKERFSGQLVISSRRQQDRAGLAVDGEDFCLAGFVQPIERFPGLSPEVGQGLGMFGGDHCVPSQIKYKFIIPIGIPRVNACVSRFSHDTSDNLTCVGPPVTEAAGLFLGA
jgi:hypothetical protein